MRKKYFLGVLALSLVAGVGSLVLLSREPPAKEDTAALVFPDKVNRKVLLSPETSDERLRIVDLQPDGITRDKAQVWFRDGSTGFVNYRSDGTVSTFGSFYPEDGGNNQVKLDAAFDLDGKTFLREAHFRLDGTQSRAGLRLPDGNYEIRDFYEDGTTLAALDLYDRYGDRIRYRQWFATGVVKQTVDLDEEGATVTVDFNEEGLKTAYHRSLYSKEVWEKYQKDGETLIHRFEMKASSTEHSVNYYVHALYYNEDGSLNHEREFGTGYMLVIFRNAEGEVEFAQRYTTRELVSELKHINQDNYVLLALTLGDEGLMGAPRYFMFDQETGTVSEDVMRVPVVEDEEGFRLRFLDYRTDGTLKSSRVPTVVDGAIKTVSTNFEEGTDAVRFDPKTIKPEWLKVYPFTLPPKAPLVETPSAP